MAEAARQWRAAAIEAQRQLRNYWHIGERFISDHERRRFEAAAEAEEERRTRRGEAQRLTKIMASWSEASGIDISDDELSDMASKAARRMNRLARIWKRDMTSEKVIRADLLKQFRLYRIEPPQKLGIHQILSRMGDAGWWRRALRKRFRLVEHAAIKAGAVHAKAGRYVSEKTMVRAMRNRSRVAAVLASMQVVNQCTGEVIPLEDVAAASLSNPANRRKAMMARIRGIEEFSKSREEVALFLTITCPSRMHARHITGAANPAYDGTSPRAAQLHLNQVWRLATRKLANDGVSISGIRVVEPHHDACPHWHVLVFVRPEHANQVTEAIRAYALADSPSEPGADEHRFKVEHIDPKRGSAVGYVAKYVSKSIDGEGVDVDDETGDTGADAAQRVVAWARAWGIRQFQFFGVPPITPTRELYRLKEFDAPSQALKAAHDATRSNNYGQWLHVVDAFEIAFKPVYVERDSARYPDEVTKGLRGLLGVAVDLEAGVEITTRVDEWRIEPRKSEAQSGDLSPPWTRFNNCAPIDFKGNFQTAGQTTLQGMELGDVGGGKRSAPHRAPLPSAGRTDWRSERGEHIQFAVVRKNTALTGQTGGINA